MKKTRNYFVSIAQIEQDLKISRSDVLKLKRQKILSKKPTPNEVEKVKNSPAILTLKSASKSYEY